MTATPNLEQFHLAGVSAFWSAVKEIPTNKRLLWRSLTHLVVGPRVVYNRQAPYSPLNSRILPHLPSCMRSIEIHNTGEDIAFNVLSVDDLQVQPSTRDIGWAQSDHRLNDLHLPNLEVFRCLDTAMAHAGLLEPVLAPAAQSGVLKVLELAVTPFGSFDDYPSPSADNVTRSLQPEEMLFLQSPNLHTLGLHDFNFHNASTSRFGASNSFDGQPFLDWIECFPKLHTVAVYPAGWSGVALFIMKLILHPRIKVIYQDHLKGADWDEALALAKRHGVTLHRAPNYMPAGWTIAEWAMPEFTSRVWAAGGVGITPL